MLLSILVAKLYFGLLTTLILITASCGLYSDFVDASGPVPEFLDALPTNKTALVGIQAVFQCRVYSEVHPTIKWFRRISEQRGPKEYMLDTEIFNSHIIQHNGHTYELLDVAKEKLISDETYLSKLILNGIRLQDEGFYACVAINYHGHNVREAYLHLKNTEGEENHSEQHELYSDIRTDPIEFWLLFLMPLGLAILPISVWVCYIIFKKSRRNEIFSEGTQHQYEYSDENLKYEKWMLRA